MNFFVEEGQKFHETGIMKLDKGDNSWYVKCPMVKKICYIKVFILL